MKTATVADLRNNFRQVSSWIEHGESVQILKRGRPFARLVAEEASSQKPDGSKIDFMSQLQEVWGKRFFSDIEVKAMRAAELEGEEG